MVDDLIGQVLQGIMFFSVTMLGIMAVCAAVYYGSIWLWNWFKK